MKVSIIGQGYVGLTVAIGAAKAGHNVIGFDIDALLINDLILGRTHVPGITKEDLLSLQNTGNYVPTTDPKNIEMSKIVSLYS